VWPVWPGWPLPQFGRPQAVISPESMSMDCQNCGPMPVYVGLRSIRPRSPFLISQPTSQPNWKFSRLSSIDQDRLTSMRIPSSVPAMISSSVCGPGSSPTLVMRTIGSRAQPSDRTLPA
jgi:hypothetical protein